MKKEIDTILGVEMGLQMILNNLEAYCGNIFELDYELEGLLALLSHARSSLEKKGKKSKKN